MTAETTAFIAEKGSVYFRTCHLIIIINRKSYLKNPSVSHKIVTLTHASQLVGNHFPLGRRLPLTFIYNATVA